MQIYTSVFCHNILCSKVYIRGFFNLKPHFMKMLELTIDGVSVARRIAITR